MLSQKLKDKCRQQLEQPKLHDGNTSIDINDELNYACEIIESDDEISIISKARSEKKVQVCRNSSRCIPQSDEETQEIIISPRCLLSGPFFCWNSQ